MKTFKILYNQNKLFSEITTEASYTAQRNELSLRVVFNGSEKYKIGQRTVVVFPGNFLVLNEGTAYDRDIYSDSIANTFAIYFSKKFLRDFQYGFSSSDKTLLDGPIDGDIVQCNTFLETIYPCKGDMKYNLLHLRDHFDANADDLLLDDYIYHALLLFYRLYHSEVLIKSDRLGALTAGTRHELFKRLSLAKDFVLSNYNQDISLEDISAHACLSPTHLYRSFKQTYNCSPHQYLIQTRLDNARHMLKNSGYTLNEIVNLVGFTCPSTFIKLFKNKFHFTPGIYRNHVA
jgi:AraC family transcriptional regulator